MSARKIFVAGHRGMVGSAICRQLLKESNTTILSASRIELDLLSQGAVQDFLAKEKPDTVILAAAKVGGVHANNEYPAEFIFENLQIQNNIIHGSHLADVQSLLFLGSSCIYPKLADQPMAEDSLLTGKLEPTNEPYAIAKIAGIKMCESYNRQYNRDYRSIMPTNLYGPGDNFHPDNSHVLPALLLRFHEAKINGDNEVVVWGSGTPKREFLHVDDMAAASVFVMELSKEEYQNQTTPSQSHINVGSGSDLSIRELAEMITQVVGFEGQIEFDSSKPDGSPRKLINANLLKSLGWKQKVDLGEGLEQTYRWFLENQNNLRGRLLN
ncbi:MAG: NAD-dependent epimerase/dehydratase family protein [Alphaproteobacteria bacterium]|nr:NAD-dependent epimerase/dehydratase family protein [Alphaproteobacteria bacterium]